MTREFGEPLDPSDRYIGGSTIDFSVYEKIRSRLRRPVTGGHHEALLKYCTDERLITPETLNAWRVSTMGEHSLRFPIYAYSKEGWQIVNSRIRRCLERDKAKNLDWFEVKGGPTELLMGNHLLGVNSPSEPFEFPVGAKALPNTFETLVPDRRACGRIVITEGQWDAMTAWQLGFKNVFSLPNGAQHVNVASMFRYVPEDWEVWLALDMDSQGDSAAEFFYSQLGPDKLVRIDMPYKDLNDWLKAEPDLKMNDVVLKAKGWAPSLSNKAESFGQIEKMTSFLSLSNAEEIEEGDRLVCETPWPRLNDCIGGGFMESQTTGWLAPSGVGKTTACNQIAIQAAKAGVKVGVISLEGTRQQFLNKLKKQAKGWTNYTGEAFDDMASNLLISELEGTSVTWQDCIEESGIMIENGARLIILDNLDYIMPRANASAANGQKLQAYAAFQDLNKQNNTHGICVWQPNKIDGDKIINSGDQKGMAQALQDADNYINMNRIHGLRRLGVEKTRSEGDDTDERYVWLKYDKATGCLHETEHKTGLSLVEKNNLEL